jgi:hypothetical protein
MDRKEKQVVSNEKRIRIGLKIVECFQNTFEDLVKHGIPSLEAWDRTIVAVDRLVTDMIRQSPQEKSLILDSLANVLQKIERAHHESQSSGSKTEGVANSG